MRKVAGHGATLGQHHTTRWRHRCFDPFACSLVDIELGTCGFLIYGRLRPPEGLSLFEFLVNIFIIKVFMVSRSRQT
jgi:hypothetical protein